MTDRPETPEERGARRRENPHGVPGAIAIVIANLVDDRFAKIHEQQPTDDQPLMAIATTCPDCPHPDVLIGSIYGGEILRAPVIHVRNPDEAARIRSVLREVHDRQHGRDNGHSLEHFRELVAQGVDFPGYRPWQNGPATWEEERMSDEPRKPVDAILEQLDEAIAKGEEHAHDDERDSDAAE